MADLLLTVIDEILIPVGNFLWGMPLIIMLFGIALVYTIGTRGFQFRYFGYILKNTFGKNIAGQRNTMSGITSFKAFCTALCNTLGTGNIAGVGIAIALGGPGAVFWIWMASLFAMIVKYGEILLGCKYREVDPETGMYRGSIMLYIEKGLGKSWKWIAICYAFVYMVAGFNGPCMQINTIATTVTSYVNIPPFTIGIAAAIFMGLILLGGMSRLSNVAEKIVPFMAVLYFLGTVFVLIKYYQVIPDTFALIFKSAISDTQAIAGGFGGASVAMAARYGVARGFFSNGAGCGDAAFAHSAADVKEPGDQAIWGISEVFIDGIVCTCTALVILSTGAWTTGKSGAVLTAEGFTRAFESYLGGGIYLSVIIAAFAFTTAVFGAYVGERCLEYFVKNNKLRTVYRIIMCLAAILGTNQVFVSQLEKLWYLADFNSGVVTLLSVIALFLLRKDVFEETKKFEKYISEKRFCKKG